MLNQKQQKKLSAIFELMADPKVIQIICEIGASDQTKKSLEKKLNMPKESLLPCLNRLVESEIIIPKSPSLYRLNESQITSFIFDTFGLFLRLDEKS